MLRLEIEQSRADILSLHFDGAPVEVTVLSHVGFSYASVRKIAARQRLGKDGILLRGGSVIMFSAPFLSIYPHRSGDLLQAMGEACASFLRNVDRNASDAGIEWSVARVEQ